MPELTEDLKDALVRSVRNSMWLSGLEPLPYAESRALLEKVLMEPPLVFGGRERITITTPAVPPAVP